MDENERNSADWPHADWIFELLFGNLRASETLESGVSMLQRIHRHFFKQKKYPSYNPCHFKACLLRRVQEEPRKRKETEDNIGIMSTAQNDYFDV